MTIHENSSFDSIVPDNRSLARAISAAAGLQSSPLVGAINAVDGLESSSLFRAINAADDFESFPIARAANAVDGLESSPLIRAINAADGLESSSFARAIGIADDFESSPFIRAIGAADGLDTSALFEDIADPLGGGHTRSPVDKDFEWSYTKYCYRSFVLQLGEWDIPIDEELARNLVYISYTLAFLHINTSLSFSAESIVMSILFEVAKVYGRRSDAT